MSPAPYAASSWTSPVPWLQSPLLVVYHTSHSNHSIYSPLSDLVLTASTMSKTINMHTGLTTSNSISCLHCIHCYRVGHHPSDCHAYAAFQKKQKDTYTQQSNTPITEPHIEFAGHASALLSASSPTASHSWNADTGATIHMMSHRKWFLEYEPCSTPVRLANSKIIRAAGKGIIMFEPMVNGEKLPLVTLSNVLHVPALSANLLSVLTLTTRHQFHIHIYNHQLDFIRNKELWFTASVDSSNAAYINGQTLTKMPQNICIVEEEANSGSHDFHPRNAGCNESRHKLDVESSDATLTESKNFELRHINPRGAGRNIEESKLSDQSSTSYHHFYDTSSQFDRRGAGWNETQNSLAATTLGLNLWHRRLCHIGKGRLGQLLKSDLVTGLDILSSSDPIPDICDSCVAGKQHRTPFPKSAARRSHPLELVHTDLHGPVHVPDASGHRYWVTFTCDYTRYRAVYLLKSKSDTLEAFKLYLAMAEKQTGHKLKAFITKMGNPLIRHVDCPKSLGDLGATYKSSKYDKTRNQNMPTCSRSCHKT